MNFSNPLTENEKKRHFTLIDECARELYGERFASVEFLNNGVEKGAYKVSRDQKEYIVVAANRDYVKSLLPEYVILNEAYPLAANYLPKPIAHFSSKNSDGEVILMEYLGFPLLENLFNDVRLNRRSLAYELGKVTTDFTLRTGRVITEPHNQNILGRISEDNAI